jgi:SAM-dependent methyltransferase
MRHPLHRDSLSYFGYIDIVLGELPPGPLRLLDAGCGDGRVAHELVQAGHHVTGVEYLETSVQYARHLVPQADFLPADLREDLLELPGLAPDSFDAAVLVEVYEHLPPADCPLVLANLHRLLKPGGLLIVSVPTKLLPPSKLHYRHFDRGEAEGELEQAGFRILKVIGQHRLDALGRLVLHRGWDYLLHNGVLELAALGPIRKKIFMRHGNRVPEGLPCGRYILVSRKE